jgi:hypothetical protein
LAQIPLTEPTERSREQTVKKLQLMALQYDSRQSSVQWGNLFKVFQCSKVSIKHFHEIIKRQFLMSFTPSELFVISEMFPAPSSSSSSPSSFSHSFPPSDLPQSFSLSRQYEGDEDEDEACREESVDDDENNNPCASHQRTDGNTFISCQRFLSYFFQLSKSEKQKFSDHKNYLNDRIRKKKEKYETKLVKILKKKRSSYSKEQYRSIYNLKKIFGAAKISLRGDREMSVTERSRDSDDRRDEKLVSLLVAY